MKTLKIEGMSCGHCEKRVKNALEEIEGVKVITISASEDQAVVEAEGVEDIKLIEAVEEAGYTLKEIIE
jgi:copper chaperone CopZ